VPNAITYTALFAVLERGERWPLAAALYCEMRRDGVPVDPRAYTALLRACERGGGTWHEAATLLQHMTRSMAAEAREEGVEQQEREWEGQEEEREGERGSSKVAAVGAAPYNIVLRMCARASQWHDAVAAFAAMRGAGVEADAETEAALHVVMAGGEAESLSALAALVDASVPQPSLRACALPPPPPTAQEKRGGGDGGAEVDGAASVAAKPTAVATPAPPYAGGVGGGGGGGLGPQLLRRGRVSGDVKEQRLALVRTLPRSASNASNRSGEL
jgi:pentatricopeptide repeat protein